MKAKLLKMQDSSRKNLADYFRTGDEFRFSEQIKKSAAVAASGATLYKAKLCKGLVIATLVAEFCEMDGNPMLLRVADDFKKYTLDALPTLIEKVAYISSLLNGEGRYTHWGLSRIFGEQRAQKAIRTVHSDLALELARLPIRNLYGEYSVAAERSPRSELLKPESFVLKAPVSDDELLSAHLRLVQQSLLAVAAQTIASQPAA